MERIRRLSREQQEALRARQERFEAARLRILAGRADEGAAPPAQLALLPSSQASRGPAPARRRRGRLGKLLR